MQAFHLIIIAASSANNFVPNFKPSLCLRKQGASVYLQELQASKPNGGMLCSRS